MSPHQSDALARLDQAKALLNQGAEASREGASADACHIYSQVIELAPEWALPYFMLGSERAAESDFTAAEALFARAVLLAPDFDLARYQLGLLQHSGGRPQVALVTWAPLLNRPDDQPFPHLVRGFTSLLHGQATEAVACFSRARQEAASNEALAADIGLLIQAAEAALASEQATSDASSGTAGSLPPDESADDARHVLLGNYSRSLH